MSTRAQPRSAGLVELRAGAASSPRHGPRRSPTAAARRSSAAAGRRHRRRGARGHRVRRRVSPLLDVDTLQVRGTAHLTPAQVHRGRRDPRRRRDDVDRHRRRGRPGSRRCPTCASATLEREWPHTVRITVQRAHARRRGSTRPAGKALVDGTGRVLETVADAAAGDAAAPRGQARAATRGHGRRRRRGARVAGALTGLAAVGTASVEATDHGIVLHLALRSRDPDGGADARSA